MSLHVNLQILVMRNGRMQSREETEASPLPSAWRELPISQCCDTVVVSDVATDSRSVSKHSVPWHLLPPLAMAGFLRPVSIIPCSHPSHCTAMSYAAMLGNL